MLAQVYLIFYFIAKIQSLRTFYREEKRKINKSQGTGTGAKDVYVSKWKFYEECSFLDEVICTKHETMTNVEEEVHVVDDELDTSTETESVASSKTLNATSRKRKKSGDSPFSETAAIALRDLAQASSTEEVEDEWDIFGKDVANSLRNLKERELQRRVKFAVQSAIFHATEPPRAAYPQQYAYQADDSFTAQLRSAF